jgi:hypothetical protein
MRQLLLVIGKRTLKTFTERNARLPSQVGVDLGVVGVVIADVNLFTVFGKLSHLVLPGSVNLHHQGGQIL